MYYVRFVMVPLIKAHLLDLKTLEITGNAPTPQDGKT
mgnify:CR=1 FL=1